jgi:hypothetical protein
MHARGICFPSLNIVVFGCSKLNYFKFDRICRIHNDNIYDIKLTQLNMEIYFRSLPLG